MPYVSFITELIHDKEAVSRFEDISKNINLRHFEKVTLEGGSSIFYGVLKESGSVSEELVNIAYETGVNITSVSDENDFWNTKDLFD